VEERIRELEEERLQGLKGGAVLHIHTVPNIDYPISFGANPQTHAASLMFSMFPHTTLLCNS
jgi:hypothetical protein